MQPSYYNLPHSPTSKAPSIKYGLGNINFNGFGSGITNQIEKLSNLIKARDMKAFSPPVVSPSPMNYDYEGDGSVVKYTRQQFDDLYKTNVKRGSSMEMGGNDGYFDKLFFMFQLYIAFINALMNATNMSASMIFGNQSLQNMFSVFLVNVLNMILKTNVAELTPEQLRDLLEKNRPVLQQISSIIIDEASQLLVGLSNVLSKIAMDWVQNVLPGLVKSAAVGIPSALEAAIPPLGELVEIINTGMALMASFMKIVGGVQRNVDSISQGYGHVKNAYDSLQKIKDLLSKDPAEIVKTATSAVVTPVLNNAAQTFIQNALPLPSQRLSTQTPFETQYAAPASASASALASPSPIRNLINVGKNVVKDAERNAARVSPLLVKPNPAISTTSGGGGRKIGTRKLKHRKYLKNTKHFNRYISNLRKKTARKELELINSIQELKSI
jgi:hypothetical protein